MDNSLITNIITTEREIRDRIPPELVLQNPPALVMGFVSPNVDFPAMCRRLRQILPPQTKLLLTMTAGELCSKADSKGSVYCPTEENWDRIILGVFSRDLVQDIHTVTISLGCEDIKSGKPVKTGVERTRDILRQMSSIQSPFDIDSHDTLAYTLIDGLSNSESYFIDAAYQSNKFPCLIIGGSSGGKLDFKGSLMYDGQEVCQSKAIVTFLKIAPTYRFGIFKSQNFDRTESSFHIMGSNPTLRTVTSVLDPKSSSQENFIDALCRTLHCQPNELTETLNDYSFGIVINDEIFVRSIQGIDLENRIINFYCDIANGDELFLLRKTPFISATENQFASYLQGKPPIVGGILNDCILRRLGNSRELTSMSCFNDIPIVGFSTFGELLGVNINETLTAIFFHRQEPEQIFHDHYIDQFLLQYAAFRSYFLERTVRRDRMIQEVYGKILGQLFESNNLVVQLNDSFSKNKEDMTTYADSLVYVRENLLNLAQAINSNTKSQQQISGQVQALTSKMSEISNITTTVADIAEQTGVLAINASIQAARAGETGKAFAVVSSEVRKLSNHTRDHVSMIQKTTGDIVSAVMNINDESQRSKQLFETLISTNKEVHGTTESVIQHILVTIEEMKSAQTISESILAYIDKVNKAEAFITELSRD